MGNNLKKQTFSRFEKLKSDRSHYLQDWRDLSDFVLGSRGRFLVTDDDKTNRRNPRLYNEIAKQSAYTLSAGMMAGVTSPARPWFRLRTPDQEMMDYAPIKLWLDDVEKIMLTVFARSNFYNTMQNMYLELGTFGVNAMCIYENFDKVIRCEDYTIGSYCIGMDGERKSDALYREYQSTVGAMVKRFGKKNVSKSVMNLFDKGSLDEKVPILTGIEANDGRKYDSPFAQDKPWRSVYFEHQADGDKPLLISGFNEKPFIAPRWTSVAEDTYSGAYPGIDSLGTNKSLQIAELDLAIAIEKMHNPALAGDAILQNSGVDHIAGGITYIPNLANSNGRASLYPIHEVNPRVQELSINIEKKEGRIQRAFYADLFLMITEMDRAQITATEIAERKEEKMLMLGPVLESLNYEAFDPIIDRVFNICERAGIFPPPPPELQGVDLQVEYVSVLHQAQKAVSTGSLESTVAFAGNLVSIWPEAKHKINALQAVDEYAKAKGATPKILRDDNEAMQMADAEAQAQQQAQMMASMPDMARAAKDVSQAEVDEQNLLGQLTGR